jgi:hypothetical protein
MNTNINKTLKATKYLYLTSKNRSQGTIDDWSVYLPNNLFAGTTQNTKYLKITLQNFLINYEWYTVRDNFNNAFTVYDGSSLVNYKILPASYSVYNLRDYLNILLVGKYTITYNLVNNTYTFTQTNPNSYIITSNSGHLFGLVDNVTYSGTFNSVQPVNMEYFDTLFLNTDVGLQSFNLDNVNQEKTATSTILQRIPIVCAPFDNLQYNSKPNDTCLEVSVNNTFLSSIRFWLSTNRGQKLTELTRDHNLTIKIEIYE